MNGQQDFAALLSFYRVELYDGRIRMLFHERLESIEVTSDPTAFVNLERLLSLPNSEFDLSGQVNILG